MIGKELINILTKMSKPTAPKLNLQIRSASFKESSGSHAGTGIPKRTPSLSQSQLLKAPWKSEDKSTTISKNDGKVNTKKSFENNVDGAKAVQSVDKAKIETQSNSVTGPVNNDFKLVSKEKQGIINVTKVLKDNDLDSGKRTGGSKPIENNKLIRIERKLDLPTRGVKQGSEVKVKMKTESQNNVTSLMVTTNRSNQVTKTSSMKMNDEKKTTIGSLSTEMSKKTETEKDKHDVTVNNENQSSSSLKVESSSLKNKEKNETVTNSVKVPCDSSPVKAIQLSQDVSDTNKTNADTDNKREVQDSNNVLVANLNQTAVDMRVDNDNSQVTESKDSISRAISSNELLEVKGNLSKSSSSTKLTLPEKRKVSDDPETVIAELEAYLREKFGSLVDETYEQVGETESEIFSESQSAIVEPEGATVLSFSSETESDKTSQVSSPVSTPTTATVDNKSNAFIPHPIFFKTSIKKDPGSKLHDALVSELSTVLKKRDDPNSDLKENDKSEASKSDSDKSKFPRRRISAKGNKVLGDKALRQHLEDHLTRTLHKNKIFQRQSLKVLGLDTIEIKQENKTEGQSSSPVIVNNFKGVIPPAPVPPPVPHYGAVPLHIVPKTTEKDNKTRDKSVETKVGESDSKVDIIDKIDKVFPVSDSILGDKGSVLSEISGVYNEETGESMSPGSKNDELLVYTYEHPSGRTEGVVCSLKTDNNPDSTGKHRKYITCVNIVAEKSGNAAILFTQQDFTFVCYICKLW